MHSPYVTGKWLCLHPEAALPETVCFKCGRSGDVERRPIKARRAERIGYKLYQIAWVHPRALAEVEYTSAT